MWDAREGRSKIGMGEGLENDKKPSQSEVHREGMAEILGETKNQEGRL